MTPVRGIPRRQNQDDDSTDLDDSEDEAVGRNGRVTSGRSKKAPLVPSQTDIDKVMEQARRNVAAQTGNQNIASPDEPATPMTGKRVTLRTDPEENSPRKSIEPTADGLNKRRGLLGSMFGRKRTESSSTIPRYTGESTAPVTQPSSPATPRSGKLQRRNTGQLSRANSGVPSTLGAHQTSNPAATQQNNQNWPLPPAVPESEPEPVRPNTSDGTVTTKQNSSALVRPDVGKRSQSGLTPGQDTAVANGDKVIKKKRFGKLRKAFGLSD